VLALVGGGDIKDDGGEQQEDDFLKRRETELADLHAITLHSLSQAPQHIITAIQIAIADVISNSQSDNDYRNPNPTLSTTTTPQQQIIITMTNAICEIYNETFHTDGSFGFESPTTTLDWLFLELILTTLFWTKNNPETLSVLHNLAGSESDPGGTTTTTNTNTNTTWVIQRMIEQGELYDVFEHNDGGARWGERVTQFLRYAPCVQESIALDVGLVLGGDDDDVEGIVREAYEQGVLVPFQSWHQVSQGCTDRASWERSMESLYRIMDVPTPLVVGGGGGGAGAMNYTALVEQFKKETLVFYKGNIPLFGTESYRTSNCQARAFTWMTLNTISSELRSKISNAYGMEGDTRHPDWKQGFPLLQKIFEGGGGGGGTTVRLTGSTIQISIPGSEEPIFVYLPTLPFITVKPRV